jgi:hypothetical protein
MMMNIYSDTTPVPTRLGRWQPSSGVTLIFKFKFKILNIGVTPWRSRSAAKACMRWCSITVYVLYVQIVGFMVRIVPHCTEWIKWRTNSLFVRLCASCPKLTIAFVNNLLWSTRNIDGRIQFFVRADPLKFTLYLKIKPNSSRLKNTRLKMAGVGHSLNK